MIFHKPSHRTLCALSLSLLFSATGCSGEDGESIWSFGSGQTAATEDEYWVVNYLQDSKVGHVHNVVKLVERDGEQLVQRVSDGHIEMRRGGAKITQKIRVESTETKGGKPISFETKMTTGNESMVTRGTVKGDKLELAVTTKGTTKTSTIVWEDGWGGMFGTEVSLLQQPMKPGETRTIKRLEPILNDVVTETLEAVKMEKTKVGNSTENLLLIKSKVQMKNMSIEQKAWADEEGNLIKGLMPTMQLVWYRADKQTALAKGEIGSFDLWDSTVVKLDKAPSRPHETKQVVYRVELEQADPKDVFSNCLSQTVRSTGRRTADITVRAIRPNSPTTIPDEVNDKPTEKDLAPNNLIQSDDGRVVAMANSVLSSEKDSWRLAVAMENFVGRKMRTAGFTQAFATAAEVAESLEGDCTEHAVLLAALCRARKIPARVAMGLVYYPPQKGLAYHMWTEVWIDDRWIPLDATLARGGIGGGHLKLSHSNLDGADAYSTFLPVIQVMGQLKAQVVSSEY